jgi:thioredoxin reductase (NADPH)
VLIAEGAARINCAHNKSYTIQIASGDRITARTVIIATGANYRKLPLDNMSRFEGVGV